MTYTLVVILSVLLARGRVPRRRARLRMLLTAGLMFAPQLGVGVFVLLLSLGREARQAVMRALDGLNGEQKTDYGMVKEKVRVELKRLIQKNSGRRPLIIPVILEI